MNRGTIGRWMEGEGGGWIVEKPTKENLRRQDAGNGHEDGWERGPWEKGCCGNAAEENIWKTSCWDE